MRTTSIFTFAGLSLLTTLTGCGAGSSSYVNSDTTLGKVIVYRNGVAYFERTARVDGDTLKLTAPSDKVDDFLKSLTVVDTKSGEAAPISYPSRDGGTLELKVALAGKGPHDVRLTYVTETPAWKPSYRILVPKSGKLAMQAWAIVDNTSGEDWTNVKLGVGSSSAMSFRFNLRDIRTVERQTLNAEDLFAMAPPVGGSTYDEQKGIEFSDEDLRDSAPSEQVAAAMPTAPPDRTVDGASGSSIAPQHAPARKVRGGQFQGTAKGPAPALLRATDEFKKQGGTIVVEGFANADDSDKQAASLERANRLREELIRNGLDANQVVAFGRGEQPGHAGGARVAASPLAPQSAPRGAAANANAGVRSAGGTHANASPAEPEDPIGTSHFESKTAMTVPKGSSAMVSIWKGETDGSVVYVYDAESSRGNGTYPFRAVRFTNPTDSQLEQGPVSVFGEGRFIGEGLAEPIPAHASAFVPFALDRQIVVEPSDKEHDDIARILSVQRGVFSTEIKHTKKLSYTLHNRSNEPAIVYIRHTVPNGFKLSPDVTVAEKVGGASLIRVELPANGKTDVSIEESTPVMRTTDIRTPEGLGLVEAYASSGAMADADVRAKVAELVRLQKDLANLEQRIETQREQNGEYRQRMSELHAQIVTLRLVKSAGAMMTSLEKKLQEMSDKVSHGTIDLVDLEQRVMVAKIKFQDGVADLTFEKPAEKTTAVAEAKPRS